MLQGGHRAGNKGPEGSGGKGSIKGWPGRSPPGGERWKPLQGRAFQAEAAAWGKPRDRSVCAVPRQSWPLPSSPNTEVFEDSAQFVFRPWGPFRNNRPTIISSLRIYIQIFLVRKAQYYRKKEHRLGDWTDLFSNLNFTYKQYMGFLTFPNLKYL